MAKHFILLVFVILMVPSLTTSAYNVEEEGIVANTDSKVSAPSINDVEPKTLNVHLKTVYLDGFKTEKVDHVVILSMEDFWAKYQHWQLVKQTANDIYFQKNINDISPVSKATGIFGIDNHHTLIIFNGNPKDDQIIQTFFQIDIDALEARLQTELKEGIPVKSKEHFQSVMNTLLKYQKQKS